MPNYLCTKCGVNVSYSNLEDMPKILNGRCPACYVVIGEKRYPVNIKNGITIFSAVGGNKDGDALGDRTVFEVVKRMYKQDNPDEHIIFLKTSENHKEKVLSLKPDKFFLGEFAREDTDFEYENTIRINIMNEVNHYAKLGIYPRLEYESQSPHLDINRPFVILHLRNIEKCPESPNPDRNVSQEYAHTIVCTLYNLGYKIILIGNDRDLLDRPTSKMVIDLRHKLTLPEIAWLCERSLFFVGRDSGLVHVAAAAGARIVAWGFEGPKWLPKTDRLCLALDKTHSSLLNICDNIMYMRENSFRHHPEVKNVISYFFD